MHKSKQATRSRISVCHSFRCCTWMMPVKATRRTTVAQQRRIRSLQSPRRALPAVLLLALSVAAIMICVVVNAIEAPSAGNAVGSGTGARTRRRSGACRWRSLAFLTHHWDRRAGAAESGCAERLDHLCRRRHRRVLGGCCSCRGFASTASLVVDAAMNAACCRLFPWSFTDSFIADLLDEQQMSLLGSVDDLPSATSLLLSLSSSWMSPSSPSDIRIPSVVGSVASAVVTYVGFVAYYDRPRGRLGDEILEGTQVRHSGVPNAGLGLFATRDFEEGTVLGTYPGVVVPLRQHSEYKLRRFPNCEGFVWR